MISRKITIIAAVSVLIFVSFTSGYSVRERMDGGSDSALPIEQDWLEQDLLENFEFVQDALTRWAHKNGKTEAQILRRWSPQAMPLSDRICVQFVMRQPDIGGGPPVYCYSIDSSLGSGPPQLVYEAAELGG